MTNLSYFDPFFQSEAFAVVGASSDRSKYGNKVLRCYQQHGYTVIPVNPREETIEGISCVKSLKDLPKNVKSISIITPPRITETVVDEAISCGITSIWMQPGAESPVAIEKAKAHHIQVIAEGACVLVVLGFREHPPV